MKSLRSALLLAFALSTSACGIDAAEAAPESESLDVQTQAVDTLVPNSCPATIPALPLNLPTAPTPISQIPQGRALYPVSTRLHSAYTVVVTDPNDANAFYAFGFDVRAQRVVFWLSGLKNQRELYRLNTQIAADLELIEQSSVMDLGFTWGSSGQVGGPLIPRPGVAEGAWKVAVNNFYQLEDILVKPGTPVRTME
jgi:hypothetical protein